MRFVFTEEQESFRQEVQEFLQEELAAGRFQTRSGVLMVEETSVELSRRMAQKGWIGLTWPKKFGGQERTYVEKAIMMEEMLKVQAPIGFHYMGDRQVGPAIIKFGSDWQKEYFLPRIIKAEANTRFCLLFSEPNAGSDLVNVGTRAVKDGDQYIINGQKAWTSAGHLADYGWLLARTNSDPSIPKHLGCSEFILDLKTPGITIRPIINMAGKHSFNEVFFDDVRIDRKFLVGKENDGFKQIMAQMDYERSGLERLMQNYPIYTLLLNYVKGKGKDGFGPEFYSWVRDSLAQLEIEFSVGRLLCYYTAWNIDQGRQPSAEAAMAKAYCNEYEQRLNDLATRVFGPHSQIKSEGVWTINAGGLAESYLWQPSYTLQGGPVEVLKNIIALRKLNLPRK